MFFTVSLGSVVLCSKDATVEPGAEAPGFDRLYPKAPMGSFVAGRFCKLLDLALGAMRLSSGEVFETEKSADK